MYGDETTTATATVTTATTTAAAITWKVPTDCWLLSDG